MKSGLDRLKFTEGDLHYARLGQNDANSLKNLIAFHAPQAVEKALKAVLVGHEVEFPRAHDVEALRELITNTGLRTFFIHLFSGIGRQQPMLTSAFQNFVEVCFCGQ